MHLDKLLARLFKHWASPLASLSCAFRYQAAFTAAKIEAEAGGERSTAAIKISFYTG